MGSFDEEMTEMTEERVEFFIPVDEETPEGIEAVIVTSSGNIPSMLFEKYHRTYDKVSQDIGIHAVGRIISVGSQVQPSKPGRTAFRSRRTVSPEDIQPGYQVGYYPQAASL